MTEDVRRSWSIPPEPHIEAAYAHPDLEAVVAAFQRTRHGGWLSIARALAAALGRPDAIDPTIRPEVVPRHLPAATVFLLASTSDDPPGCLGHVSARPAAWTVGTSAAAESSARIDGGAEVVERVIDAVLESVRTLSPDAVRPDAEIVVPIQGAGDSHALPVAIAAMHALLRGRVPAGVAATGGFDIDSRRFRPVPVETIPAKVAAARRWGIRTLVVVDSQPLPDRLPADLNIVRISSDPGALPLLVLQLASESSDDHEVIDAWRQALALYDLRVATRLNEPVESIMSVTAAFVEQVVTDLPRERPPTIPEVRDATRRSGMDPIVVGLAADIRSRATLHAGRTVESAWWDAIAMGLRGLGDLPEGMLGDHMVFRQPSHRSIVALDLGDLDDPHDPHDPQELHEFDELGDNGDPKDVGTSRDAGGSGDPGVVGDRISDEWSSASHPHAVLDAAIADLESRWCTRHQALFAIFASNTRWRRRLYLARRDLDSERLIAAETDLLRWRLRWEDLLDVHARRGLGMGNTDLSRQWNCVLEHAVTTASLQDPGGFACGGGDPGIRAAIADRWFEDMGCRRDIAARVARAESLSAFDLRGLLQWTWLTGETPNPAVRTRCREVVAEASDSASLGVAEWWWRMPDLEDEDRSIIHAALRRSLDSHTPDSRRGAEAFPPGVHRLIALRRAATLDLDGIPSPFGGTWVDSVVPPERPRSLRSFFEDLRSRPNELLVRTPY